VKAKNLYDHESIETAYSFTVRPPWYRTITAYIGFIILAAAIVYLIVVLYTRELRRIIRLRTAEIRVQKEKIEAINRDIMDSIQYAQKIQTALLPPGDYIDSFFPERFILYMPRNVVSGDFYWVVGSDGKVITVTADCTGHGVPGAMMSMLGMAFLKEIIGKEQNLHSDEILSLLRSEIVQSLRQTGETGERKDGMDLALCILDNENLKLEYSGANMPLYIIRNGELQTIGSDRMPIGISTFMSTSFTRHTIDVNKGDILYTFSDGFEDQFGGPHNKKFMIRNLRSLLSAIHSNPLQQQKDILQRTLTDWMGSNFQVDDILVMGIKV
jgi:serine phosphatase RsbU (regulator of sigma subunit)